MDSANQEQIEFWNRLGQRWVEYQESLDRFWHAPGDTAIKRAGVRAGDRVIDVGCGCGASVLELARMVGPTGSVLGLDVSKVMLARARERAQGQRLANVEFAHADASTYAFAADRDAVFSRFGVMFFREPIAAFANLRRALRPGGRLTFVCFRERELNTWWTVPVAAASTVVAPPPPTPPREPGPFALGEEGYIRTILEAARFADIVCEAVDFDLILGADLEGATDFTIKASSAASVLATADRELKDRAREAVQQSLSSYSGPSGVKLRAATWIVRARCPARSN